MTIHPVTPALSHGNCVITKGKEGAAGSLAMRAGGSESPAGGGEADLSHSADSRRLAAA